MKRAAASVDYAAQMCLIAIGLKPLPEQPEC